MIHIDNNVISLLAQDDAKASAFESFLVESGQELLVNCVLLYEATNSSDTARNEQRLAFLKRAFPKRFLKGIPQSIMDVEFNELFKRGGLTAPLLRHVFTDVLDAREWDHLNERLFPQMPDIKENMRRIVQTHFSGRIVAKTSNHAFTKTVGDFMQPWLRSINPQSKLPLHWQQNVSKFVKASPDQLRDFERHHSDFVAMVKSGSIATFQDHIHDLINELKLDKAELFAMSIPDFNRRDIWYMHMIRVKSDLVPSKLIPGFLECMGKAELADTPGYQLFIETLQHLDISDAPAKQGDPADLFYLFVAPYVDLMVLDKAMKENVRQTVRKVGIDVNAGKLFTISEFMKGLENGTLPH